MISDMRKYLAACALIVLAGCMTTTTIDGKEVVKEKPKEEQIKLLVDAGTLYLNQDNPQRVKDLMRRALEIDPKSAEAHHLLALSFWKTMEMELAEDHFRKAVSYKQGFSQANLNYAVFLYQQGRAKEAEKYVNATLEDTLYEQRALAYRTHGLIQQQLGEHAKAVTSFRRSLALERSNPAAMFGLAVSYYETGEYAQANRYYLQARENSKPSPDSLLLGIRIADKVGDTDAKGSYELALKNLFPDSPESKQYFRQSE
ncbi:MAG: type IV pilus biogenesis/stability protein PilW [Gammaproteobacteria bacterium]|nr:MAG: type IV pilus biogenesis/stability protein PilW [Gammaproteobacteria bacterium]